MSYLRSIWALGIAASVAACSGNLGGGQSTLPGAPQGNTNVAQVTPPTPTASPVSASNVATIGDSVAPQPLPPVMGWSGSIAFPALSATPLPNASAKAPAAAGPAQAGGPVSIGVTAAVVEPADAPRFGSGEGKERHSSGKHADPTAIKGLLYISLLATADVTLSEYPKIAVDVPREIAAKYRDDLFALALFDPQTKDKAYRLAVAERDPSSPAPDGSPTSIPTPASVPVAGPSGNSNVGAPFTPPPVGLGVGSETLPPEHVAFLGTATPLTLKANRPIVFAFYVVPAKSTPSPSPSSTASAGPDKPAATPTPMTLSAPSATPAGNASPASTPSPNS